MAGFYAHHVCDGGAYLLSVAAFTSPPLKEGGYSFTTPMLSLPVPVFAVARPRTRASSANVHKRAKPVPRQLGHGDTSRVSHGDNLTPSALPLSQVVKFNVWGKG